jgi:hypothetical protein
MEQHKASSDNQSDQDANPYDGSEQVGPRVQAVLALPSEWEVSAW